jgi:predicted dehydrogenase
MTVRILQVGAGIRGRQWAEIVRSRADVTCAALVEPDAGNLGKAREILGSDCPTFGNLDEALGKVAADAALIVSPDRLHAEHALRCLEAGLTVLIEKPLAPTLAEAETILRKAVEVGRQVIVAEQYRFWPAERTVLKLLRDGAIGRVDHATLVDRRNQPASGEGPWFAGLDYAHLQDIAVHHFDSLRMWLGRPTSIFARAWRTPWSDYQRTNNTEAVLTFGDVHVQYVGTLASHRFGTSLWIEGEQGVIWTNRKYVAARRRGSRWFLPVRNVTVPKGDEAPYPRGGTTSLLDSLAAAVRNGAMAETSAADNIWSIAMLEAGRRADRERREVAIEEVYAGTAGAA